MQTDSTSLASELDSRSSPKAEEKLSIGKAAKFVGVSIDTLRRWEKKGKITSYRSPGNHRYFLKSGLEDIFGQKYSHQTPTEHKFVPEPTPIISPAPQAPPPPPPSTPPTPPEPERAEPEEFTAHIPEEKLANLLAEAQVQPKGIRIERVLIFFLTLFLVLDIVIIFFYFWARQQMISPVP